MAPECRDLASEFLAPTPAHALLHYAALRASQPVSRSPAVLSVLGRSDSAHHVNCAEGRLRRRPRCRLPELEEGEEDLPVPLRRRGQQGAGAPAGSHWRCRRGCWHSQVREAPGTPAREEQGPEEGRQGQGLDPQKEGGVCVQRYGRLVLIFAWRSSTERGAKRMCRTTPSSLGEGAKQYSSRYACFLLANAPHLHFSDALLVVGPSGISAHVAILTPVTILALGSCSKMYNAKQESDYHHVYLCMLSSIHSPPSPAYMPQWPRWPSF
jgi:hypothetical protein